MSNQLNDYGLNFARELCKILELSPDSFKLELPKVRLVVLLSGDLGVGKTELAKSFLSLWDLSRDQVMSPTFLKLIEYSSSIWGKVCHLDLYRIEETSELEKLDLESYADQVNLWIVEWPKMLVDYWKQNPSLRARVFRDHQVVEVMFNGIGKYVIRRYSEF